MKKAIVIFSGGQDSTTCLYWAIKNFDYVETVFFNYNQKHSIEYKSAKKIAGIANVKFNVLDVPTFNEIGGSSLTDNSINNPEGEVSGIPMSFVPGRNLIFITFTAALGYVKKIYNIVTGVSQTDYSNYPDCRKNTIESINQSVNLGMESNFKIFTPLMGLTKSETVELAVELECYDILKYTHTCYNGKRPPCRKCPACILREKGFEKAGYVDPLLNLKKTEIKL